MTNGYCDGCNRFAVLAPLHGLDKGGPLRCFVCAGAWHAEHGRRRKMGRVVIRAMKAFVEGGGSWDDVDKLKLTAFLGDSGKVFSVVVDPLGYMADTAKTADETVLLTSEILAGALRLTHPDVHPPERRDLANRVTAQLLALQPFVCPAIKPKPVAPDDPRNAFVEVFAETLKEPLRLEFPCPDCASTIPWNYCTACRAEWDRRQEREREQRRPQQRKWYAQRKARLMQRKPPTSCAACGMRFKGKRKDARFCTAACRQRAHRTAERSAAISMASAGVEGAASR